MLDVGVDRAPAVGWHPTVIGVICWLLAENPPASGNYSIRQFCHCARKFVIKPEASHVMRDPYRENKLL